MASRKFARKRRAYKRDTKGQLKFDVAYVTALEENDNAPSSEEEASAEQVALVARGIAPRRKIKRAFGYKVVTPVTTTILGQRKQSPPVGYNHYGSAADPPKAVKPGVQNAKLRRAKYTMSGLPGDPDIDPFGKSSLFRKPVK